MYSIQHALVKLIDSWKYAPDIDNCAATVSMDLSKTFDCIPHGLQIIKMITYMVLEIISHVSL